MNWIIIARFIKPALITWIKWISLAPTKCLAIIQLFNRFTIMRHHCSQLSLSLSFIRFVDNFDDTPYLYVIQWMSSLNEKRRQLLSKRSKRLHSSVFMRSRRRGTNQVCFAVEQRFPPSCLHENVCRKCLHRSVDFTDFQKHDSNENFLLHERYTYKFSASANA